MYTLYWNNGSASITAHMALEESGAPYSLKFVDMDKGEHQSAEYLKINPNGKVPTLLIDGKRAMFETCAIALYIADRHPASGLAPAMDDPARARYLQWMVHLTNSIQPHYMMYYYPERCTTNPAHVEEIKAKASELIAAAWAKVDKALAASGPYMAGDRFSAADLPVVDADRLAAGEGRRPRQEQAYPAPRRAGLGPAGHRPGAEAEPGRRLR